jgi:formylglycine-generating enzyme required for sulfatase activity
VSAPEGHPAADVSWQEAVLFCNWLSAKEARRPCYRRLPPPDGKPGQKGQWHCDFAADGYRLPTEAEWEYLCRAGTTTDYSFGDDARLLPRYAVTFGNSDGDPWPGGSKLPNDWGLFDTHGNLSEWCWDWYGETWPQDNTDPQGPGEGRERVQRGGNFMTAEPRNCRSGSLRFRNPPEQHLVLAGFRVVRTPAAAAGGP